MTTRKGPPRREPAASRDPWDEVLSREAVGPQTIVTDSTGWEDGESGGKPDIAGINRGLLAKAQTAAHITDEEMKAGFYAQFKAVKAHLEKLQAWLKEDEAREGWEESQAWHRTYRRAGYLSETLAWLVARDHVLVCPNCGFGAPAGSEGLWEAISLRGLLNTREVEELCPDGEVNYVREEGALSWSRFCEPCQRPVLRQQADVKWRGEL